MALLVLVGVLDWSAAEVAADELADDVADAEDEAELEEESVDAVDEACTLAEEDDDDALSVAVEEAEALSVADVEDALSVDDAVASVDDAVD